MKFVSPQIIFCTDTNIINNKKSLSFCLLFFHLQQSPVKLHTKYDGNSNVTNPSASISITTTTTSAELQHHHHESNSSPLSQHQLSPRSNTSSPPISTSHVSVPGELWSVARLSLDRQHTSDASNAITSSSHHHQHHHIHHPNNARLPFYRNDLNLNLNKHFHATAFSHITGHHNNNNISTEATTTTTRQGHSHTIV